ncbi:DinB family protein [Flavobacteriaceae bacterium AU392]|nr:DinB family protein [Flavobacteriaceae bacterium]RKM86922.1 DinB family protein [Flavobacteriaceae bacterium AU392]
MEFSIDRSVEILRQTPSTLEMFLSNLSDDWIFVNEGKDTWNAFDIIGHFIHGEKTDWIPRLNIILDDNKNKKFDPYDRFAQFENSKGKTLNDLLQEFKHLRNENLNYLESLKLTEDKFDLAGIHPAFGAVTIKQLISAWTVHDLGHIYQITRVFAKQYKESMGPFAEYISIVKD